MTNKRERTIYNWEDEEDYYLPLWYSHLNNNEWEPEPEIFQKSFLSHDKNILSFSGSMNDCFEIVFDVLGYNVIDITTKQELDQINNYEGVILKGGSDISPKLYKEKNQYSNGINGKRDFIEGLLIRKALRDNKPIMGICRGHQMITAFFGGTLFQDITKQKKKFDNIRPIAHRATHHQIIANNLLKKYIPHTFVNSYHHQAVKKVPDGFKVLAYAHDSVIESIYKPGILGVQFHPEALATDYYQSSFDWIQLFEWFVSGLQP